jgi:hypothetical protein
MGAFAASWAARAAAARIPDRPADADADAAAGAASAPAPAALADASASYEFSLVAFPVFAG